MPRVGRSTNGPDPPPVLHEGGVGDGRVHADAADPFAGDGFLEFLVGESGREILEQNGFEAP